MNSEAEIEGAPVVSASRSRRLLRSIAAIIAGFAAVVVLSVGTDEIMHRLGVYPPWRETMEAPGLLLVALGYRIVYTVLGGYIAAWLAPDAPMRHAVILGLIGLLPGAGGVMAALSMDLGPVWYPVAIFLTGLPCCWLGGVLYGASPAPDHRT